MYLGSIVTNDGGAEEDVNIRVRRANAVFNQLCPIDKLKHL